MVADVAGFGHQPQHLLIQSVRPDSGDPPSNRHFSSAGSLFVISAAVRLFVLLFSLSVQPTFADNTTVKFKHMVVLGDSLSDQGNLFFATSDLGQAFLLPPIPAADHYYMGRFSNGENYAGLLAQKLGITLTPSESGGSNYAFGGARTDYNRVEFRPTVPPPLPNARPPPRPRASSPPHLPLSPRGVCTPPPG